MLKISRFIDGIGKRVGKIFPYLVLFMMITGVYEVIMRYFFNRPTIWVWELNGLLLSSYVALGGGYALLTNTHVKVDIIYARFSNRTKAIMDLFSSSLLFLFLGVLFWQTGKMSLNSVSYLEHSQTLFGPPIYPFKVILAIGVFLFLLQGVSFFIRNLYIAFARMEVVDNDA